MPDYLSESFASVGLPLAILAVLVVWGLLTLSLWNRRRRARERENQAQRLEELNQQFLQKEQEKEAQVAARRKATQEQEEAMTRVMEQLQDLAKELEDIGRHHEQKEAQRRMRQRARAKRRITPSRRPYPIVAGMKAVRDREDREWKNQLRAPNPKPILSLGRLQLWRSPNR
jgi:biopolymer transport protein ExbB/TolQ